MENKRKDYPSFPPNYVTLLQLQERWIKQQQRKQNEKEKEERRQQQKFKEDQGRRTKFQGQRPKQEPVSRWQYRRMNRVVSNGNRPTVEVSRPEHEKSEVEAALVVAENGSAEKEMKYPEERKKAKKKTSKEKKKKNEIQYRAKEEVAGGEMHARQLTARRRTFWRGNTGSRGESPPSLRRRARMWWARARVCS